MNKYNSYDRLQIYARTEEKAKIERLAKKKGMSVSRYMIESSLGEPVERE